MKNSFTLFEIIVVVIILWLLLAALSNFFQMNERDYIRARWCVDHTYWQIKNFIDMASTWKWLYDESVGEVVYPDEYELVFNEDDNYISFRYIKDWTSSDYKKIELEWSDWTWENYCYDNSREYYVSIWEYDWASDDEGLIEEINLSTLFQWDINTPPVKINNDEQKSYWYISFYFSPADVEDRRIISKIIFDRRVNQVRHNKCTQRWENYSTCQRWAQTFNEMDWIFNY